MLVVRGSPCVVLSCEMIVSLSMNRSALLLYVLTSTVAKDGHHLSL